MPFVGCFQTGFNTQPPEGGWAKREAEQICKKWFQHTAARRRLGTYEVAQEFYACVSTHSRPKAAGTSCTQCVLNRISFNTQPPEGGWQQIYTNRRLFYRFNTQPPEGGWEVSELGNITRCLFQHTAARRRLVCAPRSVFARH